MTTARKSRWGTGIVLVLVVFLVVMLSVVGYLMTQDVNLVTEKYYEKEIAYQGRIRALERTRALGSEVRIETGPGAIIVRYPATLALSTLDGRVLLYRPSGRTSDRVLPAIADSAARQVIPFSGLSSGLWRAQVQWIVRGEEYYLEQPFMVP
jgi:hypothetical protein